MSRIVRSLLTLLIGLACFILLPLLGWGIGDIRGFMENPVRADFIILDIILMIYFSFSSPEVGKEKPIGTRDIKRQHYAVIIFQVLTISLVIITPFCDRWDLLIMNVTDLARAVGLLIFTPSYITMHWVEAYLGKQFSVEVTIQKDHELLTGGPFKYIRHPRYLGITGFTLGIALIFRSWVGIIILFLMFAAILWRIYDEEKLMQQEFGTEWEKYSQKTWRLLPFIY